MKYIYNLNATLSPDLGIIKNIKGVEDVSIVGKTLTVTGNPDTKEIESLISSDESYTRYTLKVSIDCAECARKVEEELKKDENNAFVSFSFTKGTLTLITKRSLEYIRERCREVEDEIEFLDEMKKYTFRVSIDCAECAKKVENALNDNPAIEDAVFDYPKGKLTLSTTLSEDEIKAICRNVEDEIEFINDMRNYVFTVSIDCAECASKVEKALRENENIKKAVFNYPKGKLYVTSSLSEEEIRKLCLSVEDDMSFHTASIAEKKDWSIYKIICAVILFIISKVSGIGYIAILS